MQIPLLQALRRERRMWRYGDESNMLKQRKVRQKYPSMAYAGRLDPMASGKLLVLIGDECKEQKKYHTLDKEYEFSVLFGVSSDTGDVLGRLRYETTAPEVSEADLRHVPESLHGSMTLPYPHFSSKTIQGKPLHVWTLEGRLGEIEIPNYTATIYALYCTGITQKTGADIADEALQKIETIPTVTEASKALGQDFRRKDVRADWNTFRDEHGGDTYTIATFTCIASSGLYMRSLAEVIAEKIGTTGLAYHIHRKNIGIYQPFWKWGFWRKRY